MSFLFRALLVVGALTYLAQRQQGRPMPSPEVPTVSGLTAAWNTLPAETREPILRAGTAELTRRLTSAEASRDTLGASDLRPAWRGVTGN